MLSAATFAVLLALAPTAAPSPAGKTLWIVEPLYPGQDLLVSRSEDALARLMAGEAGKDAIIGRKALAGYLGGKKADLSCLTGDAACADPVDAFVGSLGLSRVVLIKGGQEDASYRFKVTSYTPATGETLFGEGTHASNLERALIAAAVKVVPLASVLEVASTPPGAAVFVDGEKVGVTPYQGQILPGERVVKLDLASHLVAEKKLDIPVRGSIKLNERLEKVPARLVVAASPEGTAIHVDGADWGVDKADKGIQPGKHMIALENPGYAPLKEEVDVLAGTTFTFERKLEPTGWTNLMGAFQRAQDDIYKRHSYFTLSFERGQMWGNALNAKQSWNKSDGETIMGHRLSGEGAPITGISVEYGQAGKYFGIMVVGAAFYRSQATWTFSATDPNDPTITVGHADANIILLRAVQPQLRAALWRLLFFVQGGPEGRMIMADLKPAIGDASTLYVIDFNVSGELGARLYLADGFYLEGILRHAWAIGGRAAIHGFHGGIGYAF
jgi:hypothetical protein